MNSPFGQWRAMFAAVLCVLVPTISFAYELRVEVGATRSRSDVYAATDQAVRSYMRRAAYLGNRQLESRYLSGRLTTPFTLPLRVVLTQNGVPLPTRVSVLSPGSDLIPTFDGSGPRSFPAGYQTLLENTFAQAKPAMNAVFGSPKVGGIVHVRNYDADIQDRYAVGGGYYIPNGPDGPEIRFPVYFSAVSAAVNYVHTLLLAYSGDAPVAIDAVSEGLVRAATMRVVRTPNSLPDSPDPAVIEATLDSLYDVSTHYDWYNQPALGGPNFIAPNLLGTTLPPGGSTGGAYLIRYMMAGTAWGKVLTEYPGFAAEFNSRYYQNPTLYVTMDDFVVLGQEVIDFLLAAPSATVEGLSFHDWAERQFILDDEISAGIKILIQPFPVIATGASSDFGVFGIDINAFRTSSTGDESLLAGTSYPVYWRPDFTRLFGSIQDDEIKIAGAYGSVVPNFASDVFSNQQYRVAVDVPFGGGISRVMLPAGSYSTGTAPTPNNFYGSLIGPPPLTSGSYEVSINWIGGSFGPITVDNFAFGDLISDSSFSNAQPCVVHVYYNDGASSSEIFSRNVNKGVGALALDLRSPDSFTNYTASVLGRLSLAGVPLQPFRVRPTRILSTSESQTLFAQWNPTTARYDLFPDVGQVMAGLGFYWRPPTAKTVDVNGLAPPNTPAAVSLLPGWNIMSVPFAQSLGATNIKLTVANEAVSTYTESLGTTIGNTVFEFLPDNFNPDLGTMVPATSFEPGKGYFIRALRPEGAVLLFSPVGFGASLPQLSTALGRPEGGSDKGEVKWEAKIDFQNSIGTKTHVIVGQSTRTRRGFDPRYDSELPPTPGGYQASILTDRAMYKEIGVWGDRDKYKLVLQGLKKGERIEMRVQISGFGRSIVIRNPETGQRKRMRNGSWTVIQASGVSQVFEVLMGDAN